MEFITYLTTFIIIILAELGDKTQLATLIFACNNPKKKWQILLGASLALCLCVIAEVTIGLTLSKYISPALINKAAGIMFLLVGLFTGFHAVKETIAKYTKVDKIQNETCNNTDADHILEG